MRPHVHVVGFGTGPQHLTREAVRALQDSDYVLAVRKHDDDDLLRVRRAICAEIGLELVEVRDPERDRDDPSDYPGAVRDWHAQRVQVFADVVAERGGRAAFLVWGDPSLYDSTLRVVGAWPPIRVLPVSAGTWSLASAPRSCWQPGTGSCCTRSVFPST
ncbi:SAM-dependent methyltransferase [Nocardioides daphniae]|uniref:SAM-dependent methyltransferase n=1 Tax=Nocardioides daphniae TaxID=402297 RepID=UPI0023AF0FBB|nr:SAM-dependent methyltransferase [Nocardioides daphniae]